MYIPPFSLYSSWKHTWYVLLGLSTCFLMPQRVSANCGFSIEGVVVQDATCGSSNGHASLLLAGGTAPFSYNWSNGATTSTATGLAAGAYSVTVTDATSCANVIRVEVSNANAPTVGSFNPTAATCQNANGAVSFSIAGGTSPYSLAWAGNSNGTQSNVNNSATIAALRSGAYSLTVTDAAGCRRVSSFTIAETGNITMVSSITQVPSCGGNNGTIRATATSGSLPFEFFINGVSAGTVFSNIFDFSNLTAGIYTLQIRDGNGCSTTISTLALNETGATAINASSFTFTNNNCPSGTAGSVVENTPSGLAYQVFNRQTGALVGALPQTTLAAGTYEIRLNTAGCISRLPFTVTEPSTWVTELVIANPTCTAGDADVDMTVRGATAGYTYAWSNGANIQDLTNVFPDFYNVSITDAFGCVLVVPNVTVLNCSSRDTFTVFTGTTDIYCVDTNDVAGSVFTVLNICAGNTNNGIINSIGTNGCVSYTAGAVEGIDTICVEVCNAARTSCDTTTVFVLVESPVDTFRTMVQTSATTTLCPNITPLPSSIASVTNLNCRPINNGTVTAINPTTGCVTFTAGTTMGYDTVCVLVCDNQGFCDTSILIFGVHSPIDTTVFNVSATTEGTFCPNLSAFANPVVSASNLNCAVLNGGVINGINSGNGCTRYQAGNVAGLDTFCLAVCDTFGFCDTTVVVFNVVPAPDTVRLNFFPGDAAVDTCLYNIQYPGVLTSVTNLGCDQNTVGTIAVNSTTGCVRYTPAIPQPGSGLRADTVCLVVCDNTNPNAYCDTVIYIFNNIEPTCGGAVPDNLSYQVNDCATAVSVCLPIPLDSISDYDVLINGTPYTGSHLGCSFITRIQYPVVLVPACSNDFIITWTVNGTQYGPAQVTGFAGVLNQLNAWDSLTTWTLTPNGNVIVGINNGNDNIQYGNLSIACVGGGQPTILGATTQQQYADGSTIALSGVGNYRLTVIDQFGCVDTSLIRVVCVQPSTVLDTVFLDSTTTNCNVDISQIVNVGSITNVCQPTGAISATIDTVTNCVTFTGDALGVDSVCVVVCDSFGICDTTYFIVTVGLAAPIATTDFDTVFYGNGSATLTLCANDTIPNAAFTTTILVQPTLGSVSGNGCAWTYTRTNAQTCGRDSFMYEIANSGGSDTAWVYITVQCLPFSISGGISPNGDGLNDKFIINSLQDYPKHELMIFNRWGNVVFRTKNYQNDWEGTFDGKPLPDGAYWYLLELNNERAEVFTGYFILQR